MFTSLSSTLLELGGILLSNMSFRKYLDVTLDYMKSLPDVMRRYKLLALSVVVILTVPILLGIDTLATSRLDTTQSQIKQSHARLLKAINNAPSPEEMQPGQPNSQARFIINSTQESAERAEDAASDLGYSFYDRPLAYLSSTYSGRDVRRFNRLARSEATDISDQFTKYAELLASMQEFIEYSPLIDTADLSLGSADSNERMQRLRNGLERSANSIEASKSPISEDALDIITRAQQAQDQLEADENVEEFVETFESLQLEYVGLASEHHQQLIDDLRQRAISIMR